MVTITIGAIAVIIAIFVLLYEWKSRSERNGEWHYDVATHQMIRFDKLTQSWQRRDPTEQEQMLGVEAKNW